MEPRILRRVKDLEEKVGNGLGGGQTIMIPTISGSDTAPIGHSANYTVSSASGLQGGEIVWFEVTFNDATWSVSAVSGSAVVEITVPAGTVTGKTFELRVVAFDNFGGSSKPGTKSITAIKAGVKTPTLTAPVSGSEIIFSGGVTVATSAFATDGGTDTHASTDWKISSDASGNTVVAQALGSSDKLSHTFTGLSLTEGNTYYAWARHNGTALGSSGWSAGVPFKAKKGITAPSGRLLYRHSSNMGTVMEFNDGQARKVVILDAQYRTKAKFGTYNKDSSLTNYNTNNKNSTWYINGGSSATTPEASKTLTDAFLNDMWKASIDAKTGKQNDEVWLTYEGTTDSASTPITGVPAVRAARAVKVNGTGCDLPNIQTLMRIYCDAETIDSLDPTAKSYPQNALGSSNTGGAWNLAGVGAAWSSTEYISSGVRYVYSDGYCSNSSKYFERAVVPVLEI